MNFSDNQYDFDHCFKYKKEGAIPSFLFGLIKTPGLSGGPKSFSGVIMKKQASLVIIRMWSANYIERTKEVLSWDIPMTYTVYHIRNGTVSIISFSHQNIEERHSMSQGGLMSAECYGSYANGNM